MPKNTSVMSLCHAFDYIRGNLSSNATTRRLRAHWTSENIIAEHMLDLGFDNLVNLTHTNLDARVAWAFYAGDGLVVKVIPKDLLSSLDTIYHLPAITTHAFSTEHSSDFVIKTYPYLNTHKIDENDVETLRGKITEVGLSYIEGDHFPRNVGRLPDKEKTLVGIDSAMFEGKVLDRDLVDSWHDYIHSLFPVYIQAKQNNNKIPDHIRKGDFRVKSLHDRQFCYESFPGFLRGETAANDTETKSKLATTGKLRHFFKYFSPEVA